MPTVRTPEAPCRRSPSRDPRCCLPLWEMGSATPTTIDFGAIFPFTCVPAYSFPVYASQRPLPDATQDSVRGCWLGFAAVAISGACASRAFKAQLPPACAPARFPPHAVLRPARESDAAPARGPVPTAPRHSATDPAGRHPGGPRLSGSLSRPDRTVVARLSPVSRRADAARRRPGRHRASPRDSGFVMTAHRSTSPRASFTAASTRVRRRVRVASTTPARAALPHPPVGSAHPPLVPRRATTPAHGLPPTIESP